MLAIITAWSRIQLCRNLQESAGICRNLQDASSCVASNAKFDRKYMKMPNMPNDPNAVQVTHARIFSESLVGTKSPAAYLTARTGWILHQHRRLGDHYISLWHNMNIIDMLKYVENISKHVLWFQVVPMLFTLPSLKRALLWRCPQPKRGKLRILGTVRHWELTILTEPYWTILNHTEPYWTMGPFSCAFQLIHLSWGPGPGRALA